MLTKFTLVQINVDGKMQHIQNPSMNTMKSGNLPSNEQLRVPQNQKYYEYLSSRENNASSINNSQSRNQYQYERGQVNSNRIRTEYQPQKTNYLEDKIPIHQNIRHSNIVRQKEFFQGFDGKYEKLMKKMYHEHEALTNKMFEGFQMTASIMKESHQKIVQQYSKLSYTSNKSEQKPVSSEKQQKKTQNKRIDEKMEKKYTRITPQQKREIMKVLKNRNWGLDQIKSAIKGLSAELGIEYNTLKNHVRKHVVKQNDE